MELLLVAYNVRSALNVGSLLRTADGVGVSQFIACGYTPYPKLVDDTRLPHDINRVNKQIVKTSLGAEKYVPISCVSNFNELVNKLRKDGFKIVALEQHNQSIALNSLRPKAKVALIVGSEVGGLKNDELKLVDQIVEIPMKGQKESFNVAVAAAIALYRLAWYNH